MIKYYILLILSLVGFTTLSAEIEQVRLRFTPGMCKGGCINLLHQNLSKIRGAQDVFVNPNGDEATILLAPGVGFNWSGVNTATRMTGIALRETYLTVRGDIRTRGRDLMIVSNGDGTPFTLLGPINPSMNNYNIAQNPSNRQIPPNMRDELLQGGGEGSFAVISGPLFMPWQGTRPLYLIVERIQWDQPQKQQQHNQRLQRNR